MSAPEAELALARITGLKFRVTETGEFFAIELADNTGATRAVAMSTRALGPMIAALLSTAVEADRRGAEAGAVETMALVDAFSVAPSPAGEGLAAGLIVSLRVGAAELRLRVGRRQALDLAEAMVAALAPSA